MGRFLPLFIFFVHFCPPPSHDKSIIYPLPVSQALRRTVAYFINLIVFICFLNNIALLRIIIIVQMRGKM